MNTKLNSLNEKQRKLWAIIREALNYEDTDEDFNEFKEEAEGLLADDEEDFINNSKAMEESLSEYMLRRFCSVYPTVPITLSKVKAYLDTVDDWRELDDSHLALLYNFNLKK
jgi:hypothetical protein